MAAIKILFTESYTIMRYHTVIFCVLVYLRSYGAGAEQCFSYRTIATRRFDDCDLYF